MSVSNRPAWTFSSMGERVNTNAPHQTVHTAKNPADIATIPPLGNPCGAPSTGPTKSTGKPGLLAPQLMCRWPVTGSTTDLWQKETKAWRKERQALQSDAPDYWRMHSGSFVVPPGLGRSNPALHRNNMCPSGLALQHPNGPTLLRYATQGCPTLTGNPWTREMMQAAVE